MNTMEDLLGAMWLVSPLGLAMIACAAIGFAVTAREALGRERGLREAREQAHDDEEAAITDAKEQAAGERDRYRRLLDCHVDAALAELTEARTRPVPWPGRVLESFCATMPSWRTKLAESTGLEPREVERLLRSDLPMTPGLARQLEAFTGTPARYWERLWQLHDDHRTDAEKTVVIQIGAPSTKRESSALPAASPAPSSAPPTPPAIPPRALDVPPPVVPSPELAARSPRAKLPPPPVPRLRSPLPVRAATGAELARRAATLTSFPLQRDEAGTSSANGSDWVDAERSPLNTTLPGVGSGG
ncbi:helix-turn-helix transcriptional regulator [Sorangium sp. So ce854]|uniref:helix-turn-helix transcriptional regulator n=1 Tax=Sorangium sp. So ce854 TaxID=3133322 RepID=UPI003F60F46B